MNIAHWLERTARVAGARPALMHGGDLVADYALLHARAAALATALIDRGLGKGDRVALCSANTPDYLVAMCGVWIAGAAVVPINAKLHAKEIAFILQDSGASHVFASKARRADLASETAQPVIALDGPDFTAMTSGPPAPIAARKPDDLAWLFYTSGTTGRPKGVQITHGMLAAASLCYPVDVDPVSQDDAALYAAPMSHGAGLYAAIHLRMGARHIVPRSGGFDPDEVLALSAAHGPTSMFMAPTMLRRLTDAAKARGARGHGIKTIVYGGGPMYRADIEEAVAWFGPRFVQIYGQGECPMAITALSRADIADRSHARWQQRLASVGRAQSAVTLAIVDDRGQPLAPGQTGEIMVRGTPVMPGYWNNPDASAAALHDGWLKTGDLGHLDDDGYLTLVDRSKDVIISGGTNIYPREIEEVLLTHSSIHAVAVVGRPSPEWGEEVVAFVVPAPGTTPDPAMLDAHLLTELARFKRPKAYIQIADLPRNNYGKVLKTTLRDRLRGGPA